MRLGEWGWENAEDAEEAAQNRRLKCVGRAALRGRARGSAPGQLTPPPPAPSVVFSFRGTYFRIWKLLCRVVYVLSEETKTNAGCLKSSGTGTTETETNRAFPAHLKCRVFNKL